jgi:hypothetical protein
MSVSANSFITDLEVGPDTVVDLAACSRARWKLENESFNVLKNNGYNLEHNFGHGKVNLAAVFVSLHIFIDFGQLCSSKPTARVHGNRTAVFMISTICFQAGQHT